MAKCFLARVTFIGLLPCVYFLMLSQSPEPTVAFPTFVTRIWFLSSVNPLMHRER